MTVQEICSKLKAYYLDNYSASIENKVTFMEDLFHDSLKKEFTEKLILELQGKVSQQSTTMGEAIGIQEALAFIGSVQRQDTLRKGTRLARLQAGYVHKFKLGHDEGPVGLQLNGIGVKTGNEFIDNMEGEA